MEFFFVGSLNFQIPCQDGFKHVFDHYISHHSNYFSIILLLKKIFQGKKPKLFKNLASVISYLSSDGLRYSNLYKHFKTKLQDSI